MKTRKSRSGSLRSPFFAPFLVFAILLLSPPDGGLLYAQEGGEPRFLLTDCRVFGGQLQEGQAESWEEGSLEAARFRLPQAMAALGDGRVAIADTGNHCVRAIDVSLIGVETLLGTCGVAGREADIGSEPVLLSSPMALAALPKSSTFFVADTGNGRILRVRGSQVEPWPPASGGSEPARFSHVVGMAVTVEEGLFVADAASHQVLYLSPEGDIEVVAGTGEPGYDPEQRDAARSSLNCPVDVVAYTSSLSGFRALFVSDSGNGLIRQLRPGEQIPWVMTNFAGADTPTFWREMEGAAQAFHLDRPYRMAFAELGGGQVLFIGQPTRERLLLLHLTRSIQILELEGSDGLPVLPGRPAAMSYNRATGHLWVFDEQSRLTRCRVDTDTQPREGAGRTRSR